MRIKRYGCKRLYSTMNATNSGFHVGSMPWPRVDPVDGVNLVVS